MTDYNAAASYLVALTGDANTVIDWRVIHDKDKGALGKNLRGTLADLWQQLVAYNAAGWGVFCNINAMDGNGSELQNVAYIRAHVIDLDNLTTAAADYDRATKTNPLPQFAAQSSPGKYHVYYRAAPYTGNDFYTGIQRKLIQLFGGDKSIIDATRVMRVPGFLHQKAEPHLVTVWGLPDINTAYTAAQFGEALGHVNVIDHASMRSPLGTPEMQAPNLDWVRFALSKLDPNQLDRTEWLTMTAAIKQAGWLLTDETTLRGYWEQWCAGYDQNDAAVNLKLWNSIRDTEVGWKTIANRVPAVGGQINFGAKQAPSILPAAATSSPTISAADALANSNEATAEILDGVDCAKHFKNCYFIASMGKIYSRAGRFMDSTKFNGLYGGKHFIITSTGKLTDEAWKAATRSTVYTIPKVDHVRFLPEQPLFHIETDAIGRDGLNTYIAANVRSVQGDISPFFDWVSRILPVKSDRDTLFAYLAHAVKYPGFKIPWAPLLQSAEGIGKTIFFELMQHALGEMYFYSPTAPQLVKSGSVFNAWMRGKLFIIVNEIKIDERRELIEILKPMITDARVEIQSKGVDQAMEDNTANWLFFSNYKDAIPINMNGRRYSINYSALQSKADILAAGMDDAYFAVLWKWLRADGFAMITHWLKHYPIERGEIPLRAPDTSSTPEALRLSRSPMEVIIADGIADATAGFRGGYISVVSVVNRCRNVGLRNVTAKAVQSCLGAMGYNSLGRAPRAYMQEDALHRSELYSLIPDLPVTDYGCAQGYE
jgi:hypothetical protein